MLSSQNKSYLILLAGVCAGILVCLGLIYIAAMGIVQQSGDIVAQKQQVLFMQAQDAIIKDFKVARIDYTANLQKIDQLFVDPASPVNFITFLETTASNAGVASDITIVPSAPGQPGVPGSGIVFAVALHGDYPGILAFCQVLEKGPFLAKIKNITVVKAVKDPNNAKSLKGSLEAHIAIEALPKQ